VRIVLILPTVASCLLCACATQQQEWYRPGASQQDFAMDQGQCQAQGFGVSGDFDANGACLQFLYAR
jgi:hypothetical protein